MASVSNTHYWRIELTAGSQPEILSANRDMKLIIETVAHLFHTASVLTELAEAATQTEYLGRLGSSLSNQCRENL